MNTINLRFCHCSQLLSPTLLILVPCSQTRNFTLRNPLNLSSISIKTRFSSSIRVSMASPSATETETKPFSVLFVCLGNVCRSPAAEGVFTDLVNKRGLNSKFRIDSAGTINYHEENEADPRMRAASKRRGIQITSISRPIKPSDFVDFDSFLLWTSRTEDILDAFNKWKGRHSLPDDAHKTVKMMCSYCKKHDESEVPDPYYGGSQGFEKIVNNAGNPFILCWEEYTYIVCTSGFDEISHRIRWYWICLKTNLYKNPSALSQAVVKS